MTNWGESLFAGMTAWGEGLFAGAIADVAQSNGVIVVIETVPTP